MSESKQQRPRGVLGGEQVGFLPWLFNQINTFITVEGDFALQFAADFIRGPEPVREEKHIKRQMQIQSEKQNTTANKPEKPLTKTEQKVFVDLLKRKPNERQVPYWKRKKALLNAPNKRELVLAHSENQKQAAKQKAGAIEIDAGSPALSTKKKQTVTKARKR